MGPAAKYLLCATALAPMLGSFAIRGFSDGNQTVGWSFTIAAVLSLVICYLVLCFAQKEASSLRIEASNIKMADKDVLAFLLTYMLPLLGEKGFTFEKNSAITAYMLLILFAAVAHSNSFHFNPFVTLFFHYHFYEFDMQEGGTSILLTKRELTKKAEALTVVKLSNHLYIDITRA